MLWGWFSTRLGLEQGLLCGSLMWLLVSRVIGSRDTEQAHRHMSLHAGDKTAKTKDTVSPGPGFLGPIASASDDEQEKEFQDVIPAVLPSGVSVGLGTTVAGLGWWICGFGDPKVLGMQRREGERWVWESRWSCPAQAEPGNTPHDSTISPALEN